MRVSGKENLLFTIADASLATPDGTVREVVFPAVRGVELTLRELVHEFKIKGPVYRRTVQTTLNASYTNHYRQGPDRITGGDGVPLQQHRSPARHRHAQAGPALRQGRQTTYHLTGEAMPERQGTARPD
ncbi:hypothetical protein [Nonomuraea sp. NPDC050310]|uniref:hypothetical protein n=1 Tax=Nonomuraea sp. NPDC050310 TaxID=3154935 RepID=UPI003411D065